MFFYSTLCVAENYTANNRKRPTRSFFRAPTCFSAQRQSRARGLETQTGGKISPAARRFPPSPFREAVKPPLFVPVFRDRLLGELCDGQPIGFDPGEDCLDDVRGKAVQGKDAGDVAVF